MAGASLFFPHDISVLAAEPVRIVHREQITNFFGEQDLRANFDISATEAFEGRVQWRLAAAGRTLASGEGTIALAAGKSRAVGVRHKLPPVKEGVIFPLELHVAVVAAKQEKPSAQLTETLYLFAENPFADRRKWLESLNIHLFDPQESTAKALAALEVPFADLTNLESLSQLTAGVVIVGEDLAWGDYSELGDALLGAAARGVSVICLSPASAELRLPLAPGAKEAAPQRISFRRTEVIRELDKRFSLAWHADRAIQARQLALVAENDAILARAVEPKSGWPWVEVQYEKPSGRLVWCGLGLIRSWDDSPTPRYLLARLLETLSSDAK